MALKLTVPTISDQPDPTVEIRLVYVEEWIEALPYANSAVTVRNVLGALQKLNRSPVKPSTRLALMELYAQPYQYLMELLERHEPMRSVAAFEKRRANSDAARRIAVEMAYGYKTVLAASVGRKGIFGKNKELATALQRAVLFLAFSLMHSYDEYLPTPPHLWRELAELYRYARHTGLDGQAVAASKLRSEFQQTVDHTYKRILLTSLVDPYHLSEGDIWEVFAALGKWCDAARLEEPREVERATGLFIVYPYRDERPVTYADAKGDLVEGCQMLDANPVIEHLQQALKQSESADPARRQLLGRIVRSLGLPPKRHTPREATSGSVRLASGLSTVHHFLDRAARGAAGTSLFAAGAEEDDIDIRDAEGPSIAGPTYQTERWDLIDRGPGGVGVLRHARPSIAVGVGELLGLSFESQGGAPGWSVGVVRWLNIGTTGEYHAGVQIISPHAQAVRVHHGERLHEGQGAAGLAVPRVEHGKGATLVAPRGTYSKGSTLVLETAEGTTRVRPGALLELTESYERFGYEMVD